MSSEALKEQARRHEQKEEWKKALELYRRAISQLDEDDQPDVALHNRAGDLCVRLGETDQATEHYERAVELYVEADLPNNAIAVCKKIVRNVPARASVYLQMGRIRAQQGFLTDARQSFLTYAERVQAKGDMAEALRALEELADASPDDVDLRLTLAQQLEQHGKPTEALEQLRSAHAALVRQGDSGRAASTEARAREIDPDVSFARTSAPSSGEGFPGMEMGGITRGAAHEQEEEEAEGGFALADFEISSDAEETAEEEAESEAEALPGLEGSFPSFSLDEPESEEEAAEPLPMLGVDEEEEAAEPLPTFGLDADEEEDAEPLPTLDLGADVEEEAEPLPFLRMDEEEDLPLIAPAADEEDSVLTAEAFGERDRDARLAHDVVDPSGSMPELETSLDLDLGQSREEAAAAGAAAAEAGDEVEALIAAGDLDGAERHIRDHMEADPSELSHRQRLVEVAFRRGDPSAQAEAYLELAACLERNGSGPQAQGVYRQVLQLDPENAAARAALAGAGAAPAREETPRVASSEDYVDLGSLIFDDDEGEKTTRFQVAYEEPTGDEQADFARMLSQFKQKIAENLGADDVRAHHDLGTAYKEMGLLDEAIEEFQAALRASREHLPTYELLGQCFLDKGQPEAAVRSLERALQLPVDVEDELLGIYYYLGRAYERTGNQGSAVEYYDRVFSLDINFMDVTERLRALR